MDDLDLVALVLSGNKNAFNILVERHQLFILRVLIRITEHEATAEDLVQDSFLKAFNNLHQFQSRNGSTFRSWLYRIAVNNAHNTWRKTWRESVGLDGVDIDGTVEPVDNLETIEAQRLFQSQIDLLPNRQREALVGRVYEDLSFGELADKMGCKYDTAKANYRHAISNLKQQFGV